MNPNNSEEVSKTTKSIQSGPIQPLLNEDKVEEKKKV